MTTISENMKLSDLSVMNVFSSFTKTQLKVVRTCLVMTQNGVTLNAIAPADLEMVRAHAVASESDELPFSVDTTFAKSGIQFLHWNRRTTEWSLGVGGPPSASDGRRGGWVFFEIGANSAEAAKALAERYVKSPNAAFTGGLVCLKDMVAYVQDKKIEF